MNYCWKCGTKTDKQCKLCNRYICINCAVQHGSEEYLTCKGCYWAVGWKDNFASEEIKKTD